MVVEIPYQWTNIRDYLLENGWKRQFTWLELVGWLDIGKCNSSTAPDRGPGQGVLFRWKHASLGV